FKLIPALTVGLCVSAASLASVTKVGNGDDGADLEKTSLITTGPIWKAQQDAAALLNKLYVAGVPGLGLLIAEVQRSELLMVANDSRPIGEYAGSFETSTDHKQVYARTFAEPYAATRFFPAAKKLSQDQLISLHIHEALHRSLPPDIRENEDVVMHLTLAIASPGATFDRIQRIAGLYIKTPNADVVVERAPSSNSADDVGSSGQSSLRQTVAREIPYKKIRAEVKYQFEYFREKQVISNTTAEFEDDTIHRVELGLPIWQSRLGATVFEPTLHGRVSTSGNKLGPTSVEARALVRTSETNSVGPFVRFTAKSLDENAPYLGSRDVTSYGVAYRSSSDHNYFDVSATASLPSQMQNQYYRASFKSVTSFESRLGVKFKRFRTGLIGALHTSDGADWSGSFPQRLTPDVSSTERHFESFRILTGGAELAYAGERLHWGLSYKQIVNQTAASLEDLGDIMDRGTGRSSFGTSFTYLF
ncbi:MAG: hypothetical protein V4692_00005, partial [Bdellovibrionota bacterium]